MNDVLFGNNNKAIIKKLSKRSAQSDKKSNLFLILTIALSVCMVLSIALISAGMDESYKNQYRNKSQIAVIGPTDDQLSQMREAADIAWVGEYSALGFSYQDDITLSVIYESSEYVSREKERGLSGTMPQATNEILLEQGYIDHFQLDYKVGDTILLDLTGTGEQSEYKIAGILSNSEDENGIDYAVIISKALAQKLADDTSDGMTEINGVFAERACANVGDTISVTLRGEDGSRMTVDVPVVGIYDTEKLMDVCPVVPGSPYILMTYDTAKKLTGVSAQTGILSVEVSDLQYDVAFSKLNHIANEQATFDVNDISSSVGYVQSAYNYYVKNMYLISFILFLFGGIGLTNTLLVDFRSRKIEFGLFQAVGMTQKQVRKMLHKELQVYLGGSLAIAIIGGAVASTIFCHKLNVENHCISFQLPWLFILGLLIMLAGIYVVCSAYISSELKKSTILSSIRA